MFHCFHVQEDHKHFEVPVVQRQRPVQRRCQIHIFGNSPSPAIAIYGLRRVAKEGASEHGADTLQFVERQFYVDDGLASLPTTGEAIDLLKRTQASLRESNLGLHKIASNRPAVLEAFHPEDHPKGLKDFGLNKDPAPTQHSLGLCWKVTTDTFITFAVADTNKLFTRRGVLSIVNSLFDPLGLVAPVFIQGRTLLQELSAGVGDWDMLLPKYKISEW